MDKVLVSDQYGGDNVSNIDKQVNSSGPVIESALAHVDLPKLAQQANAECGVSLEELQQVGLLVLRSRDCEAMRSALSSALQMDLPATLNSTQKDGMCVRWIAPDEWLLSCPLANAFKIEVALRDAAGSASIAITNVSGGFSTLVLHGGNVLDVLQKSTAYDVHPDNFVPGKVVNTVFAKAQVCLRCVDKGRYEIMVRRSFADYVWHWLQVASAEYGLRIEVEG